MLTNVSEKQNKNVRLKHNIKNKKFGYLTAIKYLKKGKWL